MSESADWSRFCEELHTQLVSVGRRILAEETDDLDKVEGLRVLLRDLRMSIEHRIEEFDADFPAFFEMIRDTYHLVADTADYTIPETFVDGRGTYRIWGNIGAAADVNFTTQGPVEPQLGPPRSQDSFLVSEADRADGTSAPSPVGTTGTLDKKDLELDADGNFEIIASSSRPESGVWLPMAPQTNRIIVRNVFHGRYSDHRRYGAALLNIERLDRDQEFPPPYRFADLAEGLDRIVREAGRSSVGRTAIFEDIQAHGVGRFNYDQSFFIANGRNPRTLYLPAYWALEDGEAMVIDSGPLPEASFWVLAVQNRWMESMDFRFFPTYVSKFTAEFEPDGSVRVVLAHEDPGLPNWISTCGHRHGTLFWRWNDFDQPPPEPITAITTLDELRGPAPHATTP